MHVITVHHGNWTAAVECALTLSQTVLISIREAIPALVIERLGVHTQALRTRSR